MIYTDPFFILLLAALWILTQFLRPWSAAREWVIIGFSILFVASWGPLSLFLLLSVGAEILDHLDTQRQTTIVDTFTYDIDGLTPCSKAAMNASPIEASFMSLGIWSKFTWDWLVDGNLPNIFIRNGAIGTSRFLSGSIVIADWEYGDVSYFSTPGRGVLFPKSDPGFVTPVLNGSKYDLPWTLLAQTALGHRLEALSAPVSPRPVIAGPLDR
jgi:hypothetical protein